MEKIELAIKFGSNEIIIYRKGFGILAKEPAYLAVNEEKGKMKVKAVGKEAEKLFLSKSQSVTIYQPIQNSEIVNERLATILLSEIFKEIMEEKRYFFAQPSALVAVPCALNERQILSLKKVINDAGVGKLTFVQNGVCSRANLDMDAHAHIMVVDIGKYITDISVLNDFDFNFGRIYKIGGEDMDKSIVTFVQDNHNLEIDTTVSEKIKNEIASLYDRDLNETEYLGVDENKKMVRHKITANEIRVAITNVYDLIIDIIKDILTTLPKGLVAEIHNNGIMFVGGASSIAGLYEYAKKKLDTPIIVMDQPMDSVILGAGKLLAREDEFIKINF